MIYGTLHGHIYILSDRVLSHSERLQSQLHAFPYLECNKAHIEIHLDQTKIGGVLGAHRPKDFLNANQDHLLHLQHQGSKF